MLSLTSPVETPWHDLPAGLKVGILLAMSIALVLIPGWPVQAAACLGVACLYAVGGGAFMHDGARRLRPLVWLLALLFAWHVVTGGLETGVAVGLRILALVALANLVTMTTRLDAMLALVRRGLAPLGRFGLPTGAIGLAVAMVIRFTPHLGLLAGQLSDAWRARSARRPGWRIAVPVTLAALDDADRVAEALRARGGAPRTEG